MSLSLSVGYKTRLASASQSRALLAKLTRKDSTVVGVTTHDLPLVYGGVTYNPGWDRSNVVGSDDLSNDNLQYQGVLSSPQITEEALRVGDWDNCRYLIFEMYWDDNSTGIRFIRAGTVGEVSIQRVQYTAQLDGLAKKYATTFGQLTGPACRHDLYDAGCTIDPNAGSPPYTVTGTITDVGDDGVTVMDSSRTEPGPTGGVAILDITNADPGVVTLASDPDPALTEAQLVTISGVLGMAEVNTQVAVHNPSGATFELGTDTSSFAAYISGGTMTPLGAENGTFDYGVITWTSGDNDGHSMEIASYVPGQLKLALPMPNAIQIGDTYTLSRGCNKWLPTCRDVFNNVINYDGEWYLTGNDRLTKIGKQQ